LIKFFHYEINRKHIKYLLFLGWVSIWASISFNPNKLIFITENIYTGLNVFNKISLLDFFDICRGSFQIFYLPLLLIITFNFIWTQKVSIKSNLFFILLLIIFSIELFSILRGDNPNINIYFLICSLNIVLTTFLLKNFFSDNDVISILKLSIFILVLLLFFFGINYIFTAVKYGINVYVSWGNMNRDLSITIPKPTGLARTALIVLIVFSNINFFKKPLDKINLLVMTFSISLIILLSSRTAIFIFFLYILFYFFYFRVFEFKKLIKMFVNFLLLPFIFIVMVGVLQNLYKSEKFEIDGIFDIETKNITRIYPTIETTRSTSIHKITTTSDFTSGRLIDWKNILNNNKNILFGNGTLGDRYLINQTASNLLFYTYSSSGIIGLLIIIYISLITLYNIYKNFFYQKIKLTNYKLISCLILIMLMLRSVLETSYGVFGIDFILFCTCSTLLIQNKSS